MKWKTVLDNWEKGIIPQLPKDVKKPFIWRTSCLDSQEKNNFQQEFIAEPFLLTNNQPDSSDFSKHLNSKRNKDEYYAISFKNLSGDTLLIVPKERHGKNFSSLYYFMEESSELQQKKFWRRVALEARNQLKYCPHLFISTEGTGVAYVHVRICTYPKYYGNSGLQYTY